METPNKPPYAKDLHSVCHPNVPPRDTHNTGRLGNVAYHPSGETIATASFDLTWRLWSVETGQEIMLQVGLRRWALSGLGSGLASFISAQLEPKALTRSHFAPSPRVPGRPF